MTDMLSRVASIGCTALSAGIKTVGVSQPEHRFVDGAVQGWRITMRAIDGDRLKRKAQEVKRNDHVFQIRIRKDDDRSGQVFSEVYG